MKNQRRQFNGTVLPDGTVLVTGGTRAAEFNNLRDGNPVHEAELWNPVNDTWTTMAPESSDRCYHSVALLLPDGRVLSAGGGEYNEADPPNPQRNLTDGQLFEPPYLFKGPRPIIESAPKEINYGKPFSVTVGTSDLIKRVSLVRLGSVTHCRNMNQSLMFLEPFTPAGPTMTVPAPADGNRAPPGYYMLFVLNKEDVPSVASIVRVAPAPGKTSKASMRVDVIPARRHPRPSDTLHKKIIKFSIMDCSTHNARIDLAVADLHQQEKPNFKATARKYAVNSTTLKRRYQGRQLSKQAASSEYRQYLTFAQEETLIGLINSLTDRGLPPTSQIVRNLA
ncbi:hypothetical protein ABVK25_012466 [Lepraria finkii]|uniref:Galactose oxidase-like Early set domain-containing protein n=1 Tax=Lepraria finkii TaxID=1340010 RepID=A0ABR4AHA1_9LECA